MPPEINKKEESLNEPISLDSSGMYKTKKTMPNDPTLKTLRTFKGDLADTIEHKDESQVSIITAEVKAKEKEAIVLEKNPNFVSEKDIFIPKPPIFSKTMIYFISAMFFIVAGIFTFVFIYKNAPKEQVVLEEKSLIPYSQKIDISLSSVTKESIIESLHLQKDKSDNKELSLTKINFKKSDGNLIESKMLFSVLIKTFPDSILRSINEYLVGILTLNSKNIFIAISFDDYNKVYVSMIKWENLVKDDLSAIFKENVSGFVDEVYKNNDLRVAKNNEGRTAIVYGFVDKKILIIAPNEETFMVLREKYINSKLVR